MNNALSGRLAYNSRYSSSSQHTAQVTFTSAFARVLFKMLITPHNTSHKWKCEVRSEKFTDRLCGLQRLSSFEIMSHCTGYSYTATATPNVSTRLAVTFMMLHNPRDVSPCYMYSHAFTSHFVRSSLNFQSYNYADSSLRSESFRVLALSLATRRYISLLCCTTSTE